MRVGGVDHQDEGIAVATVQRLKGILGNREIGRKGVTRQKQVAAGVERQFARQVVVEPPK